MSLVGRLHDTLVFPRRIGVLAGHLAVLLPHGAKVLDLGCGDGLLARAILTSRPDLSIRGADVLVREDSQIPVDRLEGDRLPYEDGRFDAVLIVDVLHHSNHPLQLLREAVRVSPGCLLIKDHLSDAWLSGARLRLMDFVGNAHHGVALPYRYWTRDEWLAAFRELGLSTVAWRVDLGLYPKPLRWIFEDGLHFVAQVGRPIRHDF